MFDTYSDESVIRTPILGDSVPEKFMDANILKAELRYKDNYLFI